jgi:CAAX protease family protein
MAEPGLGLPTEPSGTSPTPLAPKTNIFRGPHGIRAGWRALIFLAILAALVFIFSAILRFFTQGKIGFGYSQRVTPFSVSLTDSIIFVSQVFATVIMARIENRRFGQYGLPAVAAFRTSFWIGIVVGFLAISSSLFCIFLLGGFRVTTPAIHGSTIASAAVAWGIAFLIVGLGEEFGFRGYLQFTLTTGMGFWPSAIVVSLWFALAHAGNPGENKFGVFAVLLFALLFCLFLRRTGNLWWAVGFHAGWDWGETFFYGVPDSGLVPYHSLFKSVFSGPKWLSGGRAGLEASIFTPVVLLITAILFSRFYRENRYRPS